MTARATRHLLADDDLTPAEQTEILDLAERLRPNYFTAFWMSALYDEAAPRRLR